MSGDNSSRGLLLLLAASLIWSTTPIFSKLVYKEGLHPLLLVELRLLMGFLLLLAIGKDPRSARGKYIGLVKLALFGLAANYLVYHLSVYYTSASSAQVLEGTAPAFVLIFALLTREEAVDFRKAAGVALTLMGTLLIFYAHLQRIFVAGDLLGVLAALTWAYFIVQGSRTLKKIEPAEALAFLFGLSALLLLPFMLPFRPVLNAKIIFIVVAMGLFHTFAAYMLYFKGIKLTTPITAGLVFALNPLITVYLSKLLLGETAGTAYYLGVLITIAGILSVVVWGRST